MLLLSLSGLPGSSSAGFQIRSQGPIIDVLHVQFHPTIERDATPAAALPQTGDPRTYAEAAAMPVLVKSLVIANGQRAGTDKRHIALQHIKQLRQIVQYWFYEGTFRSR